MSNPNFVSDLVAMAKAFEELPIVQEALRGSEYQRSQLSDLVQRLELRIIDLKTELDAAHAATRKVEVERDHAERMFLETDDRLNAFRRLVQAFDTDVKSLVQAAEPESKPEPAQDMKQIGEDVAYPYPADPGPAIGGAFEGQGDVDPTASTDSTFASLNVSTQPVETQTTASSDTDAGVSVQPDPTQATESSSESGLSGSGSQGSLDHTHPDYNERAAANPDYAAAMEVTPSAADPTASSTAGDGHSPETATPMPTADTVADVPSDHSAVDDVGYHNEPKIIGTGAEAWAEWDKWCERMNHRYPHSQGGWPPRTQAAQ